MRFKRWVLRILFPHQMVLWNMKSIPYKKAHICAVNGDVVQGCVIDGEVLRGVTLTRTKQGE